MIRRHDFRSRVRLDFEWARATRGTIKEWEKVNVQNLSRQKGDPEHKVSASQKI
jgi:hypothetical protein